MLIPVYYKSSFQRFVTSAQLGPEVAGKIIPPRADAYRVARRVMLAGLESWVVSYRSMTPTELAAAKA